MATDPSNMYVSPAAVAEIDNLISGTRVPMKVVGGDLAVAAGTAVKRGTPLQRSAGNAYAPATNRIDGVLLEDASSEAGATFSVPVATSGEFNLNSMDMTSITGVAVNPITVDEAVGDARARQIYIAPQNQAPYIGPDNFVGGA
jgi:hypothetical protein